MTPSAKEDFLVCRLQLRRSGGDLVCVLQDEVRRVNDDGLLHPRKWIAV
eukprot:CAMPEP_0183291456 /NCGR_PEP_ID=MMETSP0160_2-20130417/876_1 /TAXON_ID=2839 ORGANISM="Odontella Sinensis, Strain Grunow 1884" /NCGR_SAMPLE_ID=MMETSP0160_2 /ASSEMBLY_ACC=CAM_ASM_000250 /LENGTH=48 /DNA_ID= /DNA_START= /DNA_END= /DNA_ORIENTATION=